MRLLIILVVTICVAGCGTQAKLKNTPVSVSGKVSQGGKPVGGLMMVFQPLGDGHMRVFPIQTDGSFRGELITGEYAYYVTKPAKSGAGQVPAKLLPKYFEADLARTVKVEPDTLLAIALD